QDYRIKEKKAVKIKDPGRLLDNWSGVYDFSTNKMHSFYSYVKEPVKMMKKIGDASENIGAEYAMTMHAGASLVAPFVRFTDVHFYIRGRVERWVKELDLRPVEFGGTIHLIEPSDSGIFYRTQNIEDIVTVSNIQLYLDLYNYPARGREQAEFLRKEKIGF
ncbi:MAG: type IV toxin-antitoxin system AbiEi family antitoxin, partial [Candidatus Hydrothermarchaeaceae archaeon]